MKSSTSLFTAVLAAALAVPGLCGSRAAIADSLKPTVVMPTVTTPPGNGHVHALTPAVLAQDNGSTFTGSVPKPTETLSCATSLGTVHHTTNGKAFLLGCDHDFAGNDLSKLQVADWASCMEACSVAVGCEAFVYQSYMHSEINCYLKTAGTSDTWYTNQGHWVGWLASSATKTPTSATTTIIKTTKPYMVAAYTPLSTYHQLDDVARGDWEMLCYTGGASLFRDDLVEGARYFCSDHTLGGFYPDGVLLPNDGVTLKWIVEIPGVALFPAFFIVTVKDGCAIDFNSMNVDECVQYFRQDLIDTCGSGTATQGGTRDNNCTQWVADPQLQPQPSGTKPTWYRGEWDGVRGDGWK